MMMHLTQNRVVAGSRVLALSVLLAALLATLLSTSVPPAGAAVPAGKAFAWGYNDSGQLGNGTSGFGTETNTPAAVSNLEGVKSVKAGHSHGLALMNNGTVRAWGYGETGELGHGTFDSSDVPVKVKNLTDVKAIAAGYDHNLALKENGSVWAWGDNYYGQLGNGTSGAGTDSNVPVKVANLGTGVKGIAAGDEFSLALMKDGTVKSWGYNADGQLGNGTDTDRNKPGPVSNLSNVKAIATDSDADHVLALLESGRVKSWGYNGDGQLGNGTSGNEELTPVNVSGLTNVRSISGGAYHSLAILESGRARSWGYNGYGELGNGTDGSGTYSDVPVAVKNLSNVKNIDGGGKDFTLAATQ